MALSVLQIGGSPWAGRVGVGVGGGGYWMVVGCRTRLSKYRCPGQVKGHGGHGWDPQLCLPKTPALGPSQPEQFGFIQTEPEEQGRVLLCKESWEQSLFG